MDVLIVAIPVAAALWTVDLVLFGERFWNRTFERLDRLGRRISDFRSRLGQSLRVSRSDG